jgi:uncharacterized membrane protein YbhN (UPF0104 family)
MKGKLYIALLIGLVAIIFLAAYAGLGETWATIKNMGPSPLLGIFALVAVCSLIAGIRLRALLTIYGHKVSHGDAYHINTLGMVGNALTPGVHVGGEALRVVLLRRHGVDVATAISSSVLIKILDALVVLPLALLLALRLLEIHMLPMVVALLFFPYLLVNTILLRADPIHRCVERIASRVGAKGKPAKLNFSIAPVIGIGTMGYARWLILGLQDYLVLSALGVGLSYAAALAVFTVSTLVRVAAPIPFGLGATEAATVGLYSWLGVELSEATAAALVARTYVTLVLAILGAYSGMRIGLGALKRATKGKALKRREERCLPRVNA